MDKIKKFNYIKVKNVIIFVLLGIWILIPVLKEMRFTSFFTNLNEYNYMQILAIIGIYLIVYEFYKKFKICKNKKELLKELLPIAILLMYLMWTLVSAIFAKNKNLAFYGTSYRKDGFITYLIYAGFFACAFLMDSKRLRKYLLDIFILVACLTIIFIEMANNGHLYNIFDFNNIDTGVFSNSNHYGYYLLLVLLTSFLLFITEKTKVNKGLYLISYIFILYYFIKNNTFGCYIAFTVTAIIYFIYSIYIKKNITSSVIGLIIFVIMSFVVQIDGQSLVYKNVIVLFNDISKILNINLDNKEELNEDNSNWEKSRKW